MNVIRVLLLLLLSSKHLREYELKKCYIQNKGCMVQTADPTIYSLTKIIKTKTNCKTKTYKIGEKQGGMVA